MNDHKLNKEGDPFSDVSFMFLLFLFTEPGICDLISCADVTLYSDHQLCQSAQTMRESSIGAFVLFIADKPRIIMRKSSLQVFKCLY